MAPPTSPRLSEIRINVTLVIASAALWAAFWFLNSWLFAALEYTAGIAFIYFPAGVRLVLVLVFGVWGAIGIALSTPLLFMQAFGQQSVEEVVVNSLISGFVPLLAARACQWALGIGWSLEKLRPAHLPLLSLAVSIATPLALNLMFVAYGLKPIADLPQNTAAMVLGDFLGCMIGLVVAKLGLLAYRRLRAPATGG